MDTDLVGLHVAADLYKPPINSDSWAGKRLFTAWSDESFRNELKQVDVHLGAELTGLYLLTLRGGKNWDWDGELKPWSFGFSIGPETARVDYAHIFDPGGVTSGNRFSLSCNF